MQAVDQLQKNERATKNEEGTAVRPEELKAKVDELRTMIAEKLEELEDNLTWGREEERDELADALEELGDQAAVLRDILREEE